MACSDGLALLHVCRRRSSTLCTAVAPCLAPEGEEVYTTLEPEAQPNQVQLNSHQSADPQMRTLNTSRCKTPGF